MVPEGQTQMHRCAAADNRPAVTQLSVVAAHSWLDGARRESCGRLHASLTHP